MQSRAGVERVRIALVDTHRLLLDGLASLLSSKGFDVAVSAATWQELLDSPHYPVDVVVIDAHLDDGIPISSKVRVLESDGSATVVTSRFTDAASVNAALKAGALGFVPKTDPADELESAIRSASRREPHLSDSLASAVAAFAATPNPGLGRQELRALVLYADGRSIREVAAEMDTTEETVKSYIKRGRRKYRQIGIDIGTRILLRRHAVREGWLAPDK